MLYHEPQSQSFCGQHAINTLLQAESYSVTDLAEIGVELDRRERGLMEDGGRAAQPRSDSDYGNVDQSGMFSVQVLQVALEVYGLTLIPLASPDMQGVSQHPEREQAFLCNLHEHWFTIRVVDGDWWDFNSLLPAPKPLSQFYLAAFLGSLSDQGYTIFVVRGVLPASDFRASDTGVGGGVWFTPSEARAANEANVRKTDGWGKAVSGLFDQARSAAGGLGSSLVLQPPKRGGGGGRSRASPDPGDAEIAAAIAASLQGADPDGDDPELAAALAASLETAQPSTSGAPQPATAPSEPEAAAAGGAGTCPPVREDVGDLHIAFVMPDGRRRMRRFERHHTVGELRGELHALGWADMTEMDVATSQPHAVLSDAGATLQSLGLGDRSLLRVCRRAD